MYYEPSFGYLASLGVLGLTAGMIICLTVAVVTGAGYVSNAVIFMKAGEVPWKSLIPFYNTYVYFRLCWNTKMFIPYIATFGGTVIAGIIWYASVSTYVYGFYYDSSLNTMSVICLIILIFCALACTLFSIILSYHISVSFGKGGGFAVGLVLLPVIFKMIFAFGDAKYICDLGPASELRGTKGQLHGMSIKMTSGDPLIIGRDPSVASVVLDKNINNSKISKLHCKVEYDAAKNLFYLTDFSKNGTVLADGTKLIKEVRTGVKKGTEVILPNGDRFMLI